AATYVLAEENSCQLRKYIRGSWRLVRRSRHLAPDDPIGLKAISWNLGVVSGRANCLSKGDLPQGSNLNRIIGVYCPLIFTGKSTLRRWYRYAFMWPHVIPGNYPLGLVIHNTNRRMRCVARQCRHSQFWRSQKTRWALEIQRVQRVVGCRIAPGERWQV